MTLTKEETVVRITLGLWSANGCYFNSQEAANLFLKNPKDPSLTRIGSVTGMEWHSLLGIKSPCS